MTSKKPKPRSSAIKSPKGGSSKLRPAKSAPLPPPGSDPAEATSGQLVRLHDLNGVVVFYLPGEMRRILGAQMLSQQLNDLRRHAITLIARTASDVIYVDLPILVKDLPADVDALANAGEPSGPAAVRRSKGGSTNA
jgi:hypothetical protein